MEIARATQEEKETQITQLTCIQKLTCRSNRRSLKKLKEVAVSGGNIFEELMETVRVASLGQITNALV